MNTVVYYYSLCILELPLRKHVFCYLARGLKRYSTNKMSIYLPMFQILNSESDLLKYNNFLRLQHGVESNNKMYKGSLTFE